MEEKTSGAQNEKTRDREVLKVAMSTMSVDQLRELRSTIVRLKHLSFTKLTEVLFTESPPSSTEPTDADRVQEDSPAFTREFCGHCESEATRTLFEDVESILKSKEKPAGQ